MDMFAGETIGGRGGDAKGDTDKGQSGTLDEPTNGERYQEKAAYCSVSCVRIPLRLLSISCSCADDQGGGCWKCRWIRVGGTRREGLSNGFGHVTTKSIATFLQSVH